MDDVVSGLSDSDSAPDGGSGRPPATASARGDRRPVTEPEAGRAAADDRSAGHDTALGGDEGDEAGGDAAAAEAAARARKRRRGSRGGRKRSRSAAGDSGDADDTGDEPLDDGDAGLTGRRDATETAAEAGAERSAGEATPSSGRQGRRAPAGGTPPDELPERVREGRPTSVEAAERALVKRPGTAEPLLAPRIPPPGRARVEPAADAGAGAGPSVATGAAAKKRSRAAKRRAKDNGAAPPAPAARAAGGTSAETAGTKAKRRKAKAATPAAAEVVARRAGRERKGRPVGRYFMAVQVRAGLTQVAVLEGRNLIEHYVSRPADDVSEIHGNIYLGRVQNVLPGMEAAFVDIATPKNAVLYRGDVQYDAEDIEEKGDKPRIEEVLKARQLILCQVTKNPIGAKGARLTQEVSLPGRFVVLIPNSQTYGISKRLPDQERKRLRGILDQVKPASHGLIVRTAAEEATEHELAADVARLVETWDEIERRAEQARRSGQPRLLYREPELAVRVIREEFNAEYRGIVIDDSALYEEVRSYVEVMNPELADRVERYDAAAEGLPLFERFHIHEQLHKALDRKVWLPSGGSLIIEHTEALTVIDVNTGKNVGTSNLEDTVLHNNLEAAEEIARQLRLRDIGGIIVIDFIDMEVKENRRRVVETFRDALSRDKTRSQVFDISELGLVEMTRKRIGEGLLTAFAGQCPNCEGRGVRIDYSLLE